jgi:hypothetical protein
MISKRLTGSEFSFSPLRYCTSFIGSPLIAVLISVREFKKRVGKIVWV